MSLLPVDLVADGFCVHNIFIGVNKRVTSTRRSRSLPPVKLGSQSPCAPHGDLPCDASHAAPIFSSGLGASARTLPENIDAGSVSTVPCFSASFDEQGDPVMAAALRNRDLPYFLEPGTAAGELVQNSTAGLDVGEPPSLDEGESYLDARYTAKCQRAMKKRLRKERLLSSTLFDLPPASRQAPDQAPDTLENSPQLKASHEVVAICGDAVGKSLERTQSFLSKCLAVLQKLRRRKVTLLTAVLQSWSLARHLQCTSTLEARMLAYPGAKTISSLQEVLNKRQPK
jgi:hypothetical protein